MALAAIRSQTSSATPEWRIVQGLADAGVPALASALVDAWDAQRARIDIPSLAASIDAFRSDNIDWRIETIALQGAMVQVCGPIARQVALTLLPRYETEPSVLPTTEVFFNPYHDRLGRFASGSGGGGSELVPSKEWADPPPPRGRAGERRAGGYSADKAYGTNTRLGRAGEAAFVKAAGGHILHPPGKGEMSPLDVRVDGFGFEVKAVSSLAMGYKATPKPYERAQKEAFAREHGLKPALSIVVMDPITRRAHVYWRPGLMGGRLSRRKGWRYIGDTPIAVPETFTEAYADWIDLALDLRFMEAEKFLQRYLPKLIVNISAETRRAIRDVILNGFQNGKHPYEMAEEIQKIVGMTPGQVRAYQAFAANLAKGKQAASVQAALLGNYRREAIERRARNIARTETLRAANAGQQSLWRLADANGLLGPSAQRMWIATPDGRTCPFCRPMDGKTAPIDGVWSVEGYGIESPPLHPSCRCAMGLVFPALI
jgi:SPP1 gp7 family putative phage head morphogenesis protein